MYFRYLRRELAGRRKQTFIIAAGMALAVALVIIVNSVATGMSNAQASVLESVYGVGTDITVSQTPTAPGEGGEAGGPQRFNFDSGDGATEGGTTTLGRTRLEVPLGTSTLDSSAAKTVAGISNVGNSTATLALNNVTFSGEMPDFSQMQQGGAGAVPPQGGAGSGGAGDSNFSIDSFSVLGVNVSDIGTAETQVGPLSTLDAIDGRMLEASDEAKNNVVLDSAYATAQSLKVGDKLTIKDTEFAIVGIVESSTAGGESASNTYIPLDVAQSLSGEDDKVSNIYVQASSAADIAQVQSDIEKAIPDVTVKTQADLASTITGSLSSAASLLSTLGFWLAVLVLGAAFLISALFTISNVTRRTREFGTLKAIGWRNSRIVKQVAGEATIQAGIGAVAGVIIAAIAVSVINLIGPTLSASTSTAANLGGRMGGQGAPPEGMPNMPGGGIPGALGVLPIDVIDAFDG